MIRERKTSRTADSYTERYAARMSDIPDLSQEDEREKISRWKQTGDEDALWDVVFANLKVAVAVARQHRNFGIPFCDLIGLGSDGILTAIERFELDRVGRDGKPVKFSRYAWHWIRAKITRAECRHWHPVSGQATSSRRLFSLIKSMAKANAMFGPDRDEAYAYVATQQHISVDTAKKWMDLISHRAVSLESTMAFEDGDTCMKDQLVSDVYRPVDDQFETQSARAKIRRKIREMNLKPREMKILERRLMSDDPATLDVIGREENVSRARIGQVEILLKDKLRRVLRDDAEEIGIDTEAFMENRFMPAEQASASAA